MMYRHHQIIAYLMRHAFSYPPEGKMYFTKWKSKLIPFRCYEIISIKSILYRRRQDLFTVIRSCIILLVENDIHDQLRP